MSGPLDDVRVLDLTGDLGRYAGKLLAELGASVVRCSRGPAGPPLDPDDPTAPGLLDWWHDSGTRRLDLDLDRAEDLATFRRLVSRADVLIESEPPGSLDARGLSVTELASLNRALVHVSLTPYGSRGPKASWRSSDLVAQAEGGWVSVTGDPDRPIALWGRQAHTVGGFYTAICALSGLRAARRRGTGLWFDLSLHEAVISCSEHVLMYWWFAEALAPLGAPIAARQRSLHWVRAFEVVPCERGHCMVSPAAGGLLDLIAWLKERGHARDVPDDPDPETLLGLVPAMMAALHAAARELDATTLMEAGQQRHVPFGEVYDIAQVASCPQHVARGFFRSVPDKESSLRLPGPFAHFAAGDTPAKAPPTATDDLDRLLTDWGDDRPTAPTSEVQAPHQAPLAGLRVLDFTHVLAGPFATRVLGDLGADVIRLQTDVRSAGASANEFPYNVMWARNKRSIQLEMKHPQALEVLRRLVEKADVVIDNFSAGVLDSWGAGPEQLAEWNPQVVSMAMSGCGTDGPWADFVTYAPTVQALCGLTALTGPAGEADCGPGIAFNDHASGLAGALALLAALLRRDHPALPRRDHPARDARGEHVDISQFEIGTYLVGPAIAHYQATGTVATATGNHDPYADHLVNDVFLAADGDWIAITVDPEHAQNLPGTPTDDTTDPSSLSAWVAARGAAEAVIELQRRGIAAGVVQNARHLVESDAQLSARGCFVDLESSMLGTQTTDRFPARLWGRDGTEIELDYRPSAYLGEHNFEVYPELLGWDEVQVAEAIGDDLLL